MAPITIPPPTILMNKITRYRGLTGNKGISAKKETKNGVEYYKTT
jgi:hypothetical protein